MNRLIIIFGFLSLSILGFANDGAFFASGNQLIPITETDISVKKEILTIRKIENKQVDVTVYYEFYNPKKKDKEILMGFEAFPPFGDVDENPKNGEHPYMRDFTVVLNDKPLNYQVNFVTDSSYVENGKMKSQTWEDAEQKLSNGNAERFLYFYYFNATFKPGLNVIKHTYSYNLSGSVDDLYSFYYVLTAANRWANKQIDDFTLIIDAGNFESFDISNTFFKDKNDWIIQGVGKSVTAAYDPDKDYFERGPTTRFHIQKGILVFTKKNFKPEGELTLFSKGTIISDEIFDYKQHDLAFSYYQHYLDYYSDAVDEESRAILYNLPFARRGYVSPDIVLQDYYDRQEWYIPNPGYIPDTTSLTNREKDWLEKWENASTHINLDNQILWRGKKYPCYVAK